MRLRLLALVALCACVPVLAASAEGDVPPLPDRNPLRQTTPVAAPVKPPPPPLPGEQPTVPWTEAEIEAAKAKCKELLTGDPLDYEQLPADQGRHLRHAGAGAVARGRHRPEGRDQSAGDHELPHGGRARRVAARYGAAGSQEAVRLAGGEDSECELLCLSQPLWRREHASQRACARQRVRRFRVRARQRHAHHRLGRLAEGRGNSPCP